MVKKSKKRLNLKRMFKLTPYLDTWGFFDHLNQWVCNLIWLENVFPSIWYKSHLPSSRIDLVRAFFMKLPQEIQILTESRELWKFYEKCSYWVTSWIMVVVLIPKYSREQSAVTFYSKAYTRVIERGQNRGKISRLQSILISPSWLL